MACELLAPAGDFKTALTAFEAGADAVYCGLTEFSARAFAVNFTLDDLRNLLRYSRAHGKKAHVTFNTVIDEDDFDDALERLSRLDALRPDALIVQDLGVARACRRYFPDLVLHASTQLAVHNLEGVLMMRDLGFRRVVLARELSLDDIASIAHRCGDMELECFIHGALCYSISGLCLFSAMENGRSGNRGKCAYCCRARYADARGDEAYAFSMRDLRFGEDVLKLVDAGVASLKIEGRMKSATYVASVTRYYRQILDGAPRKVSSEDLETVFSRRTTTLYLNGCGGEVIDAESLGHLGAEIGEVKRVTRDRDGLSWLRFHTRRALEKHDGLQFEAMAEGRHLGMGISEMRQAISRRQVFEVEAAEDVEVLLSDEIASALKPGMRIYCSMSNAVRRLFPAPSFRSSECVTGRRIDVTLAITRNGVEIASPVAFAHRLGLEKAKSPERTYEGVRKAFTKLGNTAYELGELKVSDPEGLFVPMSVLNDVRCELVERLDEQFERVRNGRKDAARAESCAGGSLSDAVLKTVKIRPDQKVPRGAWDEVVVVMGEGGDRVATPVFTSEKDFGRLRVAVKGLIRRGCIRWEAGDLATFRMLRELGVSDITADWTIYAFNSRALKELFDLGVTRFVASPENTRENLQYLAKSGYEVEFLVQQSTPLFISLTEPAIKPKNLAVYETGGLWITTKPFPRVFDPPRGVSSRIDLSWDPPC